MGQLNEQAKALRHWRQTRFLALLLLWSWHGIGLGFAATGEGRVIELRTDSLVYVIGEDGLNRAFRDRRTGKDYLKSHTPFMSIEKSGRRSGSSSVLFDGGFLHVKFGDSPVEARVRVRVLPSYLVFELASLSSNPGDDSVSSVQLANLPLSLTGYVSRTLASCRDDRFAAAVVPVNIETHSNGTNGVLTVEADRRVRLEGSAFALAGGPSTKFLDLLERIEVENGLPHPTLGGVWARKSPDQSRSYLFCDLTEFTVDAMIDYARAGGFGTIVVYAGSWNDTYGTYLVNRMNFPNGDAGLKEVVRRIHAAGLKVGMHNLDMVVSKTDPLVWPVPAEGFMMYPERRRTLAAGVGSTEDFLATTASPAGLLGKDDKSRFYGRDLRIGDEIVTYEDLRTTPPFGFSGCRRGAHGTKASSHPAGAAIENFSEFIGFYRPDIKGGLYDRVARAEASALDHFGFDYIYPDGTGENLGNWPEQPEWYIYNVLLSKLFGYTRREVMWAHAPITDYSWHIFSRGNTTDFVQTGVIQHFDRVSLAGARASAAELQPFEFGWFGYFTQARDAEATRPREMQYAWSKALAFNAAMSLETTKSAMDGNGRTKEILSLIRNWEKLKLRGYFPARIRDQLKTPAAEFELEKTRGGRWQIVPVTYAPERSIAGEDHWAVENLYPAQPLRLTIEAVAASARFGDIGNIQMLDPKHSTNLNTTGNGPMGGPRQSAGVSFEFVARPDQFEVSARNEGSVPLGWGSAEVILDRPLDLRQHRALGTWVDGDGSGAYLHFVLEDAGRWAVRDYYVRLDFKGRRYIEMRDPARGEVYDFAFPFSTYWALRNIEFQTISRVYVFLTGVPPGASVHSQFGRVEALREIPRDVEDPQLTVNGQSVALPVRLATGSYLEYEGNGGVRVFDGNGFTLMTMPPTVSVPSMRQGSNQVAFQCAGCGPVKLTLVTRGKPLR